MAHEFHYDWERLHEIKTLDQAWLKNFVEGATGNRDDFQLTLLGGLVNTNYRIDAKDQSWFLQIVTGSPDSVGKGMAIQRRVPSSIPLPKTLAVAVFDESPVVLQEWVVGETVGKTLQNCSAEVATQLGNTVGTVLAEFRRVTFEAHGFLDADGNVETEFTMDPNGYQQYTHAALSHCYHALDRELIEACWVCITRDCHVLDSLPTEAHLTHGDFHANNILVEKQNGDWVVTGIVDWESALSWVSLLDLAHLLRRPLPQHDVFEMGLMTGYGDAGGMLPDDWQTVCRMLQILGWVDKLATGEFRPNVIATAKQHLRALVS